jgi:methylation protein EvaC
MGNEPVLTCSFCNGAHLHQVMDFGRVALAGAFLKPERFPQEQCYPLRLHFCRDCYAVQVIDKVDAEVLFQDYFYFSSSIRTLREHFASYASELTARFLKPAEAKVLEFGCNDGVLLKPLADQGIRTVIGVDPATNVVSTVQDSRIHIINDFFNEATAARVVAEFGPLDMVMANNVYAHIPDIQGTTRAIRNVLSDEGIFVFEVHYLGKVIHELQYDMIYHEHLYYYSLLSAIKHFERYDMTVFDVKPVPVHAGSMRFYVCKNGSRWSREVSADVTTLAEKERAQGFHLPDAYDRFASDVAARKDALMALLAQLKRDGRRIAGYGASGRANTMIQYCGIGHEHLDYMIDDAPAKKGYCTPGSHFEICSSDVLKGEQAPDYLLLFAWSFKDEIVKRNPDFFARGGKMIVPLPEVTVQP